MDINLVKQEEKRIKKRVSVKAHSALLLCFFACCIMMVVQYLLAVVITRSNDNTVGILQDIFVYSTSFIVAFGFAHLVFATLLKPKEHFNPKRIFPKMPLLYIAGALGACYTVNLLVNLLFPRFVEDFSVETAMPIERPIDVLLYYIFIAVLPAIFEEYAFRHVILKNLLPYGKWGAIFCSSLLFGLVHIDPPRVIFATAFGIILAICREHTGSLVVPILIHFLNNAISVTVSLYPENMLIMFIFGLLIYAFIGCGIAAAIYYSIKGLNKKKVSLNKPALHGYKLSFGKYLFNFVFNIGIIPFVFIYLGYFSLYYFS